MRLFLDANALIYLLEAKEPHTSEVRRRLAELAGQHPYARLALSRLSWLECRAKPLRDGARDVLARYDEFFALPDLLWSELDREAVELATVLRARHGLRTPDALQAACCLKLGADHVFLSADRGFTRVPGLNWVDCGTGR